MPLMAIKKYFATTLAILVSVVFANAQQASAGPLLLMIETDHKQVATGGEVRVGINLTNTSEKPVIVEEIGLFPYEVSVLRADGTAVTLTERGRKLKKEQQEVRTTGWVTTMRFGVTILPGKTRSSECAVSDWYDMTVPGDYSIQLQLDWKGRVIPSNIIEVTVTQ